MKHQYINTIVRSFINDNNISENSHNYLYNYVIEYVDECKVLDFGLYHVITDELDYTQQQKLIYLLLTEEFIEDNNNNKIEELGIVGWGSIGAAALVSVIYITNKFLDYINSTSFFRLYEYPINKLNKAAETIYKFLIKDRIFFRKIKMAHKILLVRGETCSNKCGVEYDSQLKTTTKSALYGQMAESADIDQANCLLKCFIEEHIKFIIIAVQNYRNCLKIHATKDMKIPVIDNITALITNSMMIECDEIQKQIIRYYEVFEETLTIFTPSELKGEYIKLLNRELVEAAKTVSLIPPENKRIKQSYKKLKGPFNKKNFKRF